MIRVRKSDIWLVKSFFIHSDIHGGPHAKYIYHKKFHITFKHVSFFQTNHYGDVIIGTMAYQIASLTIVFTQPFIRVQIKENIKFRVTGLCAEYSPGTGEFPAEMASNAENVSIWWRHHEMCLTNNMA